MIIEYYEEYNSTLGYTFLSHGIVQKFEEYIMDHQIPLEKVYTSIDDWADGLHVKPCTRRNYQTRMRRFIEYIYERRGVKWQ